MPTLSNKFDFPAFGLPMKTLTRLQSNFRCLIDLKFLISNVFIMVKPFYLFFFISGAAGAGCGTLATEV